MRALKFRAWTGSKMEHNIMAGWLGAFYVQGIDPKDAASMSPFNTIYSEQTPVMQYTGLHDKNGAEIYEGDIVRCERDYHDPDNVTVEWDDGNAGFCPFHDNYEVDFAPYYHRFEVIGNIFENAALLTNSEKNV